MVAVITVPGVSTMIAMIAVAVVFGFLIAAVGAGLFACFVVSAVAVVFVFVIAAVGAGLFVGFVVCAVAAVFGFVIAAMGTGFFAFLGWRCWLGSRHLRWWMARVGIRGVHVLGGDRMGGERGCKQQRNELYKQALLQYRRGVRCL
jgi:hypothetical protein